MTDTSILPRKMVLREVYTYPLCFVIPSANDDNKKLEEVMSDMTLLYSHVTKLASRYDTPKNTRILVHFSNGEIIFSISSIETDSEYFLRTSDRHERVLIAADLAILKAEEKLQEAINRRKLLEEKMKDPNYRG